MKKIYRQLLLFTSTVVFMALAPLVVFYAMGYRVGIDANSDLSVGVLQIETVPRRAQIYIDQKDQGLTPESISNLNPGEIEVAITKAGYRQWQKQIAIESTEVTELRGIRLFPDEPKPKLLLNKSDNFSLSPSRNLIATIEGRQLRVISDDGLEVIPPLTLVQAPSRLLWSPDSNSVLAIGPGWTSLINVAHQPRLVPLNKLNAASDISWDPRIPGRLLFLTDTGDLNAYHINYDTITTLSQNVRTFSTSSRNIYVVGSDNRRIEVLNLQGQLTKTYSTPFDIERLMVSPAGQIAVWIGGNGLAVLDEEKGFLTIDDHIIKAGFSPSGQLLYVQTDDTSLYVYNVSDERMRHIPLHELQLVVRLSRPIREAQWFAGGHHLIYQVNDEIIITEIDTRDHPVSYTVDTTNLGNSMVAVGGHGESILYLTEDETGINLKSTSLIVE